MEFTVAAYTDVGIQKASNQDSFCVRRAQLYPEGELVFSMVCDGMGGLQKGELASAEVIRTFAGWFDRNLSVFPALCAHGFSQVRSQWSSMIEYLHQRLQNYSQMHQVQLGTTVTGLLSFENRYLTINIGDSRIYEYQSQLVQLTEDQSLVAREIASGRITPEEARHHPQRNVLLQCLGAGDAVVPVFREGVLRSDALYLLCSDGLSHEILPEEMAQQLLSIRRGDKAALTKALLDLTELCKQREETDNITSVLIKTAESRLPPKKGGLTRFFHRMDEPTNTDPVLVETAQIVYTEETID